MFWYNKIDQQKIIVIVVIIINNNNDMNQNEIQKLKIENERKMYIRDVTCDLIGRLKKKARTLSWNEKNKMKSHLNCEEWKDN